MKSKIVGLVALVVLALQAVVPLANAQPQQRSGSRESYQVQLSLQGSLDEAFCATLRGRLEARTGIEAVYCHNSTLDLRLGAGGSIAVSDLNTLLAPAPARTGVPVRVQMSNVAIRGQGEIVLAPSHDPANDERIREALAGRNGVTSVTVASPRRLRVQMNENGSLGMMHVMQVYVRSSGGGSRGRVVLEEVVADVVFQG